MEATEAVEVCPACEAENTYPNHDVEKDGYKVRCKSCGREIMLCDECMHADNDRFCDWHEKDYYRGDAIEEVGICHRGITHNLVKEDR